MIDSRNTACYFSRSLLYAVIPMALNDNFIYTPPHEDLVIVYEDDDLVVIEKPAGLLSVPGRLPEHQDSAYLRV